jgi:hypothetical protein
MFGVSSTADGGNACIWMLATDEIGKIKSSFSKIILAYIGYFLEQYKVLYNFIYAKNTGTEKWLGRCGAEFFDAIPIGPKGAMFKYFQFKKGSLCAR